MTSPTTIGLQVRREPRINGNLLEHDAYAHTLRYGSWSAEQRVGLMQGSGSSGRA